jgi:hypothetical protein
MVEFFWKGNAKLQIQPESEGLYTQVVVRRSFVVRRLYAMILQTRTNMSQTRPDQEK